MTERHNTLVCTFDPTSPRITAFDIHEWIYTALRIPEGDVQMIQIDGVRRQVFIKMANSEKVIAVLRNKGEQVDYIYPTGERACVSLAVAGMGTKRVRVANLPPEVPNDTLKASLAPYGKVIDVQIEKWSNIYRYAVANGVRQVTLLLTKHAPSHLTVAGHRVLLSYEGQPATCYGCGGGQDICFRDALPDRDRDLGDHALHTPPTHQSYHKMMHHRSNKHRTHKYWTNSGPCRTAQHR